jgi:hypothetical protein
MPNHPMLFSEKLWIVLGIGVVIGAVIVIWRTRIKDRKTKRPKGTMNERGEAGGTEIARRPAPPSNFPRMK